MQGGTSTGRTVIDTCETVVNIHSPDPRGCRNEEPYQTTLRGLASYTLPKVDVLVSGTVRSQPPVQITGANWNVPDTVVASLLGRLPPGGLASGNTTVQLLDNGENRLYADNRRTQIDMRFAKILRFGRTRADIGVDLYNLLNSNYGLAYETTYSYTQANGGTRLNPTSIPCRHGSRGSTSRSTTDPADRKSPLLKRGSGLSFACQIPPIATPSIGLSFYPR